MSLKMAELHGVTAEVAEKLRKAGLLSSDKLLDAIAQPEARKALAKKLDIDPRDLLELGNRADLGRIKGIGPVYSDLLEFAGVDTVVELSKRVPKNLHAKILAVAAEHHVVRLPRLEDVESWVEQAKKLDRKLFY